MKKLGFALVAMWCHGMLEIVTRFGGTAGVVSNTRFGVPNTRRRPRGGGRRSVAGEGLDDPDALEAARQYTQPALIAERTARPEVELDSFPPGEPVPLLRRLCMANPELMCPPGGSLLRRSGAGGR